MTTIGMTRDSELNDGKHSLNYPLLISSVSQFCFLQKKRRNLFFYLQITNLSVICDINLYRPRLIDSCAAVLCLIRGRPSYLVYLFVC
jgi:hypothetical protein